MMSVSNAMAAHGDAVPGYLTLRCSNESEHTLHTFKDSIDPLGLRLEYILYHTRAELVRRVLPQDSQKRICLAEGVP